MARPIYSPEEIDAAIEDTKRWLKSEDAKLTLELKASGDRFELFLIESILLNKYQGNPNLAVKYEQLLMDYRCIRR